MAGKQIVQGCYAVAWVVVGSLPLSRTSFELQGRTLSTGPLHPTLVFSFLDEGYY